MRPVHDSGASKSFLHYLHLNNELLLVPPELLELLISRPNPPDRAVSLLGSRSRSPRSLVWVAAALLELGRAFFGLLAAVPLSKFALIFHLDTVFVFSVVISLETQHSLNVQGNPLHKALKTLLRDAVPGSEPSFRGVCLDLRWSFLDGFAAQGRAT